MKLDFFQLVNTKLFLVKRFYFWKMYDNAVSLPYVRKGQKYILFNCVISEITSRRQRSVYHAPANSSCALAVASSY